MRKILGLAGGVALVAGLGVASTPAPAGADSVCGELGAAFVYHLGQGNLAYANQLYLWAVEAGCAN